MGKTHLCQDCDRCIRISKINANDTGHCRNVNRSACSSIRDDSVRCHRLWSFQEDQGYEGGLIKIRANAWQEKIKGV